MPKNLLRISAAAVLLVALGAAQAQTSAPSFEVASIKPAGSNASRPPGIQVLPGGKLLITNLPMFMIIAHAYDVPYQSMRMSGGPDWIRSERYDVEAIAPAGAIPAGLSSPEIDKLMMVMLQNLLATRTKLGVRHESKELPAYAVTVSKTGLRLLKSQTDEKDCVNVPASPGIACHSFNGGMGRGLHAKAVDMTDLAAFVENWSDKPVIDKTGIKGLFEIKTDGWVPMRQMPPRVENPSAPAGVVGEDLSDQNRPTLFTVFDGMGLKLEARKLPVNTYVIESVDRPTAN